MNTTPKIGYITIFNSYEQGADNSHNIHEQGLKLLKNMKYNIISASKPINTSMDIVKMADLFRTEDIDVIIIRLATWSSDNLLLDLISNYDVPVINWGLNDMNSGSMCGAQQFNAVLKELDKPCKFIFNDTEESLASLDKYVKCASIVKALKKIRFGLIGNRTQGMAEVICDELSLKQVIGPQIISIGLDSFKRLCDSRQTSSIEPLIIKIKDTIPTINVNQTDLEDAIKNYLALKEFISQEKLSGVTIECYPNYMGKVCVGFSLLADEGIVGACESDINSLVLMWIMQNLSGSPVHHIDPNYIYEDENSMLGCHCGAGSVQLSEDLDSVEINHVRLANSGCCIMYSSKPGIITMANLIGRKGSYRMAIITGKAIRTDRAFPGNPIRIQFPFPIQQFLDLVEAGGFGHHWVVAYGDYPEQLEKICEMLNIDSLNFNNQ